MNQLRRRLPPLRGLIAFEAAARLGSFTAAANEICISQPAISRQIRSLEANLGISLFQRQHRGVELSPAGKTYYEAVLSGLEHILNVGETLMDTPEKPRITIYANYGLATYWLLPRLATFQAQFPEQDIAVKTLEADNRLSMGKYEIAIRFGSGKWHDGDVLPLFTERAFIVCSPTYLLTAPPLNTADDLINHRLLHIDHQPDSWLDWHGMLNDMQVPVKKMTGPAYNNYTLAVQAALAGQGLAIGWQHISDNFIDNGWLIQPLSHHVTTGKGYSIVVHPSVRKNPAIDTLVNWLRRQI